MVAAKTFQEWYAFFGGEEMQVSRDEAAVVWEYKKQRKNKRDCIVQKMPHDN